MAVVVPRFLLLGGSLLGFTGCNLINDSVMGGSSSGTFAITATGLLWKSHLIPENGGFASVRCPLSMQSRAVLQGASGVEETSAFVFETSGGRGATFEFRAHTIKAGEIAYFSTFQTPIANDAKQVHTIRVCDMIPRWRGRIVNAPPLVARDVDEVGFMITKAGGQRGDHSLHIHWVGTT